MNKARLQARPGAGTPLAMPQASSHESVLARHQAQPRDETAPDTQTALSPGHIMRLQGMIGNAAVQRLLTTPKSTGTESSRTIQRQPDLPGTYEWLGQIHNTWNAALRPRPHRDATNPHDNTLADLPRDTYVRVIGKEKGWLHIEVDIDGKTLTGYVSRELVKHVRDGTFDFREDEPDVIEVMTVQNAFLTLKRAETRKAKDPAYKADSKQADTIQQAIEKLTDTRKYVVDPLTYRVTFARSSSARIQIKTIEDFILFVETVERQYPSAKPREIAGEIRQMWFSDQNWDVMLDGRGVVEGGREQDIETRPNPIAEMFDMQDLAPQKGGKQISTSMGTVDIGHVMAGIDASLNGAPSKLPQKFMIHIPGHSAANQVPDSDALLKYNTLKGLNKGDPRDFATWSGDMGQAYAEYLVARWVKKDAAASFQTFMDEKSPADELLGDIHGYIATEVWKQVPTSASPTGGELKVSNVLRDLYLVNKQEAGMKDPSYQQFIEKISGQTGQQLKAYIIERTLAFGRPWYAKKAYDHRGWRKSSGWTGAGILENGMEEFIRVHEKNEAEAQAENKLGVLIQSFMDMMKGSIQ